MSMTRRQRRVLLGAVLTFAVILSLWIAHSPTDSATAPVSKRSAAADLSKPPLAQPDRSPDDAGSLSGLVITSDGQPVEGAQVSIQTGGESPSLIRALVSDSSGRFTALDLADGLYSVIASKDGLISDRVRAAVRPDANAQVKLTLQPGAFLLGTVRDALDGSEIPDCTVQTGLGGSATCDHAGRFLIGPVAPGGLALLVSAPGYAPRQVTLSLSSRTRSTADITLVKGATLSGIVLDPQHHPYPGASVRTEHYSLAGAPPAEVQTISGAQGRFVLNGVAPGRTKILATAVGYAETDGVELMIAGGDHKDGIELVLTTGGAIAGTVTDSSGHLVEGAHVQAVRLVDKRVALTSVSAGDGSFRLDGLTPAKYTVVAEANGARAVSAQVSVSPRDETDVKLVLGSEVVDGRVTTSSGKPVPGAMVTVTSSFAEGVGGQVAVTDAQGRFRVEGLTGAPYRVEAQADKHGATEKRGVKGGDHVELVLAGAGRIEGTVTDGSGFPLDDFEVRLIPKDSGQTGGVSNRYRVRRVVSPDGKFAFDDVPAGKYAIHATASGHVDAEQGTDVSDGQVARVLLSLSAGATIHGFVMHAGTPVAGCSVSPSSDPVATDSQGAFTLTGVEVRAPASGATPSTWVWADCPGNLSAYGRVTVSPGGEADITLEATAKTGRWANSSNRDFSGVGMSLGETQGYPTAGNIFDGSPAGLAGVLPGDEIVSIDGWPTQGASLNDVVSRIRGDEGTPVDLGIRRPSTGAVFDAYPERARIAF